MRGASAPTFGPAPARGDNRLLRALPAETRQRLLADLELIPLRFQEILFRPDEPIAHVYFPRHGVVSLVIIMEDGATAEVATIGNEGMVGVPVFLGARSIPGQALCQIPGEALRMPADAFRAAIAGDEVLRSLMQRYVHALFTQIAQSAACNRLHRTDARCARWLLMTHDRMAVDEFGLTQEFLAEMLGVRRAGVNTVARVLRQAGLIRYARGRITVADRGGLEALACECYGIIQREFERLLGPDAATAN